MTEQGESYFRTTLAALQEETYEVERNHGFHDHEANPLYVATKLSLIMSEAAEAIEWDRQGKKDEIPHELADIVIRTMNLAQGLGIDLGKAVLEKHAFNKNRPLRHGNKLY